MCLTGEFKNTLQNGTTDHQTHEAVTDRVFFKHFENILYCIPLNF